jgi:16S rRNA (cytosine967-C5)-methyltransferase
MNAPSARHHARARAGQAVGVWLSRGIFPELLLEDVTRDRAFVAEMVYGAVRWFRALDYVRARFAPRQPGPRLHGLLLIGLYQLLKMDGVEPYAAVYETVAAAKEAGGVRSGNFVNAVLRRVADDLVNVRADLDRQPAGVRDSHPDDLLARWGARWSAEDVAALCAWDNTPPRTCLRLTAGRITASDFLMRLREHGVVARAHPARPGVCVELQEARAVASLPGFDAGDFAVQDPSTLCAVDLLDPRPGERVLDACAAPGGKALAAAERMEGRGELLAWDADAKRLQQVAENAKRLGQPWIQVRAVDVTRGDPGCAPGSLDAVLLDVPCTNTGVLRRRPDARWRWNADRLAHALALQRRILAAAAPLVKSGGRLVYSTCSLEPEENGGQVRHFLAEHTDFALEDEVESFPPRTQADGAYAARLRKR